LQTCLEVIELTGRLNGFKEPLIVGMAIAVPAATAIIVMYGDIRQLKTEHEQMNIAIKTQHESVMTMIKEIQDNRGRVKISTEADARLRCLESHFAECRVAPR
jgi:hypothetical protein